MFPLLVALGLALAVVVTLGALVRYRAREPRIPAGLLDLARSLEGGWSDGLARMRATGVPMCAYDNLVSRTDAAALIPEEVAANILTGAVGRSAALSSLRQVRMSRGQQRLPCLSALPVAYFVNGDTGLKQTTEAAWANRYLNAEEIACIVPIPEAVLDDADYDLWGEIRPKLEEAVGVALDAAIYFGVNKPASWPSDIVTAATAARNTATRGTARQAEGGIVGDIGAMLATAEADGYDLASGVANRTIKSYARAARNVNGDRFAEVVIRRDTVEIDSVEFLLNMRGSWPTGSGAPTAIAYDPTEFLLGVRQDMTYKVLDQAAIFDDAGALMYNLPQQDMVALRVVTRVAFQVANVINRDQPREADRYPAAVLVEA